MSKPILLFQGPVFTRSGYGDHARDILRSIFELDRFDVKIIPKRWGNTPQNQTELDTDFGKRMIVSLVGGQMQQPDVFIQMTVPNEFTPVGKYNIGITAGTETNLAPKDFLDGANKMDLIITPSKFTKETLLNSVYNQIDKQTNQKIAEFRLQKPVEVLFEGVREDLFDKSKADGDILNRIKPDFNYLVVGHWLSGDLGEDRKDIGMTIKTFCSIFSGKPTKNTPGLILKTSSAGFSVEARETIINQIKSVTSEFGDKCPPIYLIFGDLTPEEMNSLYHSPKVKAMISFTKGEGFGRPLAEFAVTGKPIIVSEWSGHTDFLPKENVVYLTGELKPVHASAANKFLLKESKWFTVNYSDAAKKIMDVHKNYDKYLQKSKSLTGHIKTNFSIKKQTELLRGIFDKYVKTQQFVELKLPELKKL
jgi:hypothetical protein